MHLVMTGKRNLSSTSVRKFILGLGLNEQEAVFFRLLVGMNQAGNHEERLHYYEQIVGHAKRKQLRPLEESQLAFFQHWLSPVVYEMIQMEDFVPDAHWVASCLDPEPSIDEVTTVLEHLLKSGLVEKGEHGQWRQADSQIHSGDDVSSVHLFSYHEQALLRASDALHSVSPERRHFHVLTSAIPNDVLPQLVELTQQYEADFWRLVESADGPRDQVVQVGLHLFPSVRPTKAPRLRTRPRGSKGAS